MSLLIQIVHAPSVQLTPQIVPYGEGWLAVSVGMSVYIEFLRTWYAFELTCVPCTHIINVSGKELGNEIPFY